MKSTVIRLNLVKWRLWSRTQKKKKKMHVWCLWEVCRTVRVSFHRFR